MRRVLFALLTALVGCGCFCSGCVCPSSYGYKDWMEYRRAEIADRQMRAKPVIDALEKYKERRGRYPERLDDLVSEKLLDAIPNLAVNEDHQGKPGRVESALPLEYTPGEQTYTLWVSFAFVEQAMTASRGQRLEYRPGSGWRWANSHDYKKRGQSHTTKK